MIFLQMSLSDLLEASFQLTVFDFKESNSWTGNDTWVSE